MVDIRVFDSNIEEMYDVIDTALAVYWEDLYSNFPDKKSFEIAVKTGIEMVARMVDVLRQKPARQGVLEFLTYTVEPIRIDSDLRSFILKVEGICEESGEISVTAEAIVSEFHDEFAAVEYVIDSVIVAKIE